MRKPNPRKSPRKQVLAGEKVDFPTFLIVWNEHLGETTPDLHLRMAVWLEATDGRPTRLLMCFREAAKSWIISLFVVWKLYRDPNQSFIMLSSTDKLAAKNASFVRDMIEAHPLARHLKPAGQTELWQRSSFNVVREQGKNPNFSVQALSLKSDITGLHANQIFADDLETSEGTRTPEGRELLKSRRGKLRFIAPRITYIGTPHAGAISMYKPMLEDPEHIDSMVIPVYEEGEEGTRVYSWPEERGEEYVNMITTGADAISQGEFDSQMMLKFVDLEAYGLQLDIAHPYSSEIIHATRTHEWTRVVTALATISDVDAEGKPIKHDLVDLLLSWDPASASGTGDDSVASVCGRSRDDRTFVHHVAKLPPNSKEGWKPQIDRLLEIAIEYGVRRIVVETNNNPALPAEIRMAIDRKGLTNIKVVGIHNTIPKEQRVRSGLEASLSRGRCHIHASVMETKFAEQARDFPHNMVRGTKRKNDWLDSVAFGVLHLRKLPPGVVVESGFRSRPQVRSYELQMNR